MGRTGRKKKEQAGGDGFINWTKLGRQAVLVVYDVFAVLFASVIAILMRFEFHLRNVPDVYMIPIRQFMPILVIVTLLLFYLFRLYNSLWAFAGENELQNVVVACVLDGVINAIGLQFLRIDLVSVPTSYYFLYTFLLITMTFVSRFAYRFFRSKKHRSENRNNSIAVMVVGAGEAGNIIIKDIQTGNYSTRVVRCIIDDDPSKWGRYIQGVRVVGGRDKIIESADLYHIDEIILALPSAPRPMVSRILEICKETNCRLQSLPGMY